MRAVKAASSHGKDANPTAHGSSAGRGSYHVRAAAAYRVLAERLICPHRHVHVRPLVAIGRDAPRVGDRSTDGRVPAVPAAQLCGHTVERARVHAHVRNSSRRARVR
eukprot:6980081-Prymnesium_polylepis.1